MTLWLILVTMMLSADYFTAAGSGCRAVSAYLVRASFRIVTSVALATPVFYSGLVLLLIFAIQFKIAPVAGYKTNFPDNLRYLWLPALTLCGVMVPITARVLQSSILETLDQEFVETAVVRGLGPLTFMWRYLLRPSLAPTVSLLGYMIGQLAECGGSR